MEFTRKPAKLTSKVDEFTSKSVKLTSKVDEFTSKSAKLTSKVVEFTRKPAKLTSVANLTPKQGGPEGGMIRICRFQYRNRSEWDNQPEKKIASF